MSHGPESQTTSSSGVDIRQMTEQDSTFVGLLMFETFKTKVLNVLGRKSLPYFQDAFIHPSTYAHNRHRIFVSEVNGKPAGAMLLKMHGDRPSMIMGENIRHVPFCLRLKIHILMKLGNDAAPAKTCVLDALMVQEGHRGQGIGQAMLDKADQEAIANHCTAITLTVADGNRARRLYERNGYVSVGRQEGWFIRRTMGSDFTVMTKQLPSAEEDKAKKDSNNTSQH